MRWRNPVLSEFRLVNYSYIKGNKKKNIGVTKKVRPQIDSAHRADFKYAKIYRAGNLVLEIIEAKVRREAIDP